MDQISPGLPEWMHNVVNETNLKTIKFKLHEDMQNVVLIAKKLLTQKTLINPLLKDRKLLRLKCKVV